MKNSTLLHGKRNDAMNKSSRKRVTPLALVVFLLAFVGMARADEVTVYDGTTTNNYVPAYVFYFDDFTKSQYVIPANDLAEVNGGTITSVKFYTTGNNMPYTTVSTVDVYLKEVDYTTISAFEAKDDCQVVYTGTMEFEAEGEGGFCLITFDTPFTYYGGNLLVGCENTTDFGYKNIYFYGQTVDGASVAGYNSSSLDGVNPTQRNFIPKTTFYYSGGVQGANLVTTPDPIDLGYRPNGAWMRPLEVNVFNLGTETTINSVAVTNNSYFQLGLESVSVPFTLGHYHGFNVNLSTVGNASGVVNGNLVVNYGDNEVTLFDVSATAYTPVSPDVWEQAQLVDAFPFTATLNANSVPLYDNYRLPPSSISDGADAVYKLVFTEDTYLNASVTSGENGKVALYTEDFNGVGGPDFGNSYTRPQIGGNNAPFTAMIGEGTSTFGYFPFYTLYNYSIAENLFLASELEAAGVTTAPMTSLSWYSTNSPGFAQQGITIWMANVDDETLTTTSHVVTGMTKVYTGAMTPEIGWNEFVFNEDTFAWDGYSNILIYCQRNNGEWNSTVYWQATSSMPFNASSYKYQDASAYDPTVAHTMTTSTTRPNIIFKSGNISRNRETFVYDFETDLQGWINIDNDGDGYGWIVATDLYTGTEGYGANGSDNFAMGYSYAFSSSYDCDDYLVSPQAYTLGYGANLSFYYDQQSNDRPDYMEVCVSTAASPTAADFTPIWNNGGSRRGNGQHRNVEGGFNRLGNWTQVTLDLSAYVGQNIWIAFHHQAYNQFAVLVDDVTINSSGGGSNGTITDLTVTPGTYYLVASSTSDEFTVEINTDNVPCPEFATNPGPTDAATEVGNSVLLTWNLDSRATEYRLMFGTTYYCEDTLVDWTNGLSERFFVSGLNNNTNYFWRIDQRNGDCPEGVLGQVWGFTTHLNVPLNLYASDFIHEGEELSLYWDAPNDRSLLYYNIYQDGVMIDSTYDTYYTIYGLPYNINPGYNFNITAVYDEGESNFSNTRWVRVTGEGTIEGYVYEQDGVTPIQGVRVEFQGTGQIGGSYWYYNYTDENGHYSLNMIAGTYTGISTCSGYQDAQHGAFTVSFNELTSSINFVMDEVFSPVAQVVAEYYPDANDPSSPYVKVYWATNESIEDFETGDFSMFNWQLDYTYPWSITTTNPYEGAYCMKSGGTGVANVVSNMTVTVNIPADGVMSFFGKISCESNWDYGYFYIDGVQKAQYTGTSNWAEKSFDITAGDHTFMWQYTKDGSVNSNDDCFYVDYITFYKQPEPPQPAQPGWHTYAEGDFNNAVGSNVGTSRWAYEYPVSLLGSYAGFTMTKVSLFSDNMYSAVGGNYTCTIYQGGNLPMEGTAVSTITVDVPQNQNAWVDFDLTTPVSVTGNDNLWVVWTANTALSSWPAGCTDVSFVEEGTWWNAGYEAGYGWEHQTYGTWTMRQYFTNREGRGFYSYANDNAPVAVEVPVIVKGAPVMPVKGVETVTTICANPNAVPSARVNNNTRAFSYYRLYRTNAYNEGPYTDENTELLASGLQDTLYIDVNWPNTAPGVYKWGVGCVYSGNRGEEIEVPITWSEPVSINDAEANREAFNYGFEGGMLGWTTIDADGDGIDWFHSSNSLTESGYDYTGSGHNSSDGFMVSASYSDVTYNSYAADNYLVSPQKYTLEDNASLNFYFDYGSDSYPDYFEVCVATANNPSANDFTSVWNVNMRGNSEKASVRHNSNRNMNWRNVNVNLSAYAGQQVWIAFHHQDYDEYEVWIDDVTINAIGGGILQEPRESEIVWSNFLGKDMYLNNGEVDLTVTLNSGDSPAGTTVSFTNLNPGEQQFYPIADIILDGSGYYAWNSFRKGDYQVTITKEGYTSVIDNVSIWDATSLSYILEESIPIVNNLYVSSTGWAMWEHSENGDTFSYDFDNGIPADWTTIDADGDGYTWVSSMNPGIYHNSGVDLTGTGHNNSAHYVISCSWANGLGQVLYPDNYLVSPQVTLAAGSTFSFWACAQDASYAADHFGVFISDNGTSNWTMVQEWTMTAKGGGDMMSIGRGGNTRAQGNWYHYTVDLSAYVGSKYVAIRHFNCSDQFILNVDDIELTFDRNGDRHFEYSQVILTDIQGIILFSENTMDSFIQLPVDNLVEGQTYHCKVASVFSTGMTQWAEVEWVYQACDNFEGASDLTVETTEEGNLVSWTYPENERDGNHDMLLSVSEDFNDGLIAYYPFDGNVDDYSGYGNHGTIIGNVVPATDRHGNPNGAYRFPGEPFNYISVPDAGILHLNSFTLSAWVYSDAENYGEGYLINKGRDINNGSYRLYVRGVGATTQYGGSNDAAVDSEPTVGQWHMITGTVQGDQAKFYIDGVLMDERTLSYPFVYNNAEPLTLGMHYYTGVPDYYAYPLLGVMDDVRIYNRVLTDQEVFNLYGSNSVLGAMVYRENELVGFTHDNYYLDEGNTGNHQYSIRVVYGGPAICPNNNVYYSMSCSQSTSNDDDHWNVDIHEYPYNMNVTGIIQINGVEQQTPTLEIGAFCGDECRGTQRLTYFPQVDRYLVFLTLYGDAGDVMSFRLYDHALGQELDLSCLSTITFVPDGFMGNAFDPYVFSFGNTMAEQVSNFSQGYNWWGTYIEQEGIDGLGMLQNGLGDNGVTIRSQASGYTDYYQGYGWYGSLSSINNEFSYRVITSAPCTVTMTGNAAVPSQHPITLSQGWTWIGYVPSTTMSVDAALANLDAVQGDKLKSQQGYADYYVGYGWYGSLNTIEPGMGLMYYSTNGNPISFTYPDNGRGGEPRQNLTAENNHWVPNVYAYPDNMTVMAVVELDNVELSSDNYELAAFTANGECRGSVRLTYAEPLHRHVAFLTISGKDAAELSFRLYDTETGMEYYDAEESLDFVADAIVGESNDLYVIHFRGNAGMDEFASGVKVYPNPVSAGERFSIGMNMDIKSPVRVEIVNALGAVVSVETSTQAPASIVAPITAGVYTLRITVKGKGTAVRKLVVK